MKPYLIVINSVLLICIAYFCVQVFYKQMGKEILPKHEIARTKPLPVKKIQDSNQIPFEDLYETITNRNLFNVPDKEKKTAQTKAVPAQDDATAHLKKTQLDLTLLGTVISTPHHPYAVIEDNTTKLQALYQIGDKVQDAAIKQILRDRVILTYDRQDYVLEMDSKQMPASDIEPLDDTRPEPEKITVNQSLIDASLENIDDLKRQVRVRPLVANGRPDGLLIYGIKPDSLFSSLGLKNGDVIRQVNGSPVLSMEDAVKFYQSLEETGQIQVSLLRRGNKQDILYTINSDE